MLKKQTLYQLLKLDIQQGIWSPLQVITQQQLASYYQVSRIPVRDAVGQLLAEGWLISHGKAGIQIPNLTAEEAEELCQIRLQLEPLALRLASKNISLTQLAQAEEVLNTITNTDNLSAYQRGELNWQFHAILYQSCHKPHLLRILQQLHQQVARYIGFQEYAFDYQASNMSEHQQLIALLRAQNIDAACQLLTAHINAANDLLLPVLRKLRV
jgi:DNA-binding GntR family transcriptional regulator